MQNVRVEDNRLIYGGIAHFRGNAHSAAPGAIGEKRTPFGRMPYLEVKDQIPTPKLGNIKSLPVQIDFKNTKRSAFGGAVTALIKGVPVTLKGDQAFDKLQEGELELALLTIPTRTMIQAINASPDRRASLDRYGADGRVVTQLFIVVDATIASQLQQSGSVSLGAGVKGLEAKLSLDRGSKHETAVSYALGSGFAYLLAKPKWGKGKDKDKVLDLNDDQPGLN